MDGSARHGMRVSRAEWRLLGRLAAAGAFTAERAHPLPGLRRVAAGWEARLEARGLLRRAGATTFYVDPVAYARSRRRRQWRLTLAIVLAVATLLVGVLVWLRAGALRIW
jgi:hypothetical protein